MVDPITGAIVAKTVNATRTQVDQVTPGLLKSILGPPAREFGDALGRTVAYRTRNFGRIIEKANARLQRKGVDGIVNIRVAYALLEEGSLCDDELMAEYLGGLLAASKSPGGRDDRAITWTRVVTGLSSFQIRAHYLIYRELATRLHELAPDLDMSFEEEMEKASMYLDREEFESALMALREDGSGDNTEEPEAILRHSLFGLCRDGLLYYRWHYAKKAKDGSYTSLRVKPTGRGMELYGWALGVSDLLPRNFASRAFKLEIPTDIPRLEAVQLLDLHKKDDPKPTKRTLPRLEEVELTLHIMLAELAELRAAEPEPPKSKPEPVEDPWSEQNGYSDEPPF